mgnify:CR=1 FL=1
MRVYYDRDCDVNLIKDKKIAILGYGSQGHAHALNLRDSGARNLVVALREGSASRAKAEAEGLQVMDIAEAAKWADLIMFTMPDELQAETYRKYVHDNLREGAAKLEKNSAYRQIVDDGLAAQEQHSRLTDPVEAHDWLHGSLARSEASIRPSAAGTSPITRK